MKYIVAYQSEIPTDSCARCWNEETEVFESRDEAEAEAAQAYEYIKRGIWKESEELPLLSVAKELSLSPEAITALEVRVAREAEKEAQRRKIYLRQAKERELNHCEARAERLRKELEDSDGE